MAAYTCHACGLIVEVDDPDAVELWARTENDWMGYVLYSGPSGSSDRRELHRCDAPPKPVAEGC